MTTAVIKVVHWTGDPGDELSRSEFADPELVEQDALLRETRPYTFALLEPLLAACLPVPIDQRSRGGVSERAATGPLIGRGPMVGPERQVR